jgi:DNA ligase 1
MMRAFSELYEELDTTTSTNLKVAALVRYFKSATPADAAWAAYILSGHRLKRFIGPALLYRWLTRIARRRPDKAAAEANTLADLQAVLLSCSRSSDSQS